MDSLTDRIVAMQARLDDLRKEAAQIEAELRNAKSMLTPRRGSRTKSRHGFTNGKRKRSIQNGSSVFWAKRVLQDAGHPLKIDALVSRINEMGGRTVKKTTLISNLSRYIKHRDTFTRPGDGTYGLIEFSLGVQRKRLPTPW